MNDTTKSGAVRMFTIEFLTATGGRRIVWTRCYVPTMTDADCHAAAMRAARIDYPGALCISIS